MYGSYVTDINCNYYYDTDDDDDNNNNFTHDRRWNKYVVDFGLFCQLHHMNTARWTHWVYYILAAG